MDQSAVSALSSEGYFVNICSEVEEKNTLIVECSMFFTDTDENGDPARPFCIEKDEPRLTKDNRCVACDEIPCMYLSERITNSVICPICSSHVKKGAFKTRRFRGIFRIVPNGPAQILPPLNKNSKIQWMTNNHMIEMIANVLRPCVE